MEIGTNCSIFLLFNLKLTNTVRTTSSRSTISPDKMNASSELPPTHILPINHAVAKSTIEAFTIAFITLYALLFLLVYIQLFLVLYYRFKRLSYQTVLLFLCLIWAALRTILFSFFIQDVNNANVKPNMLQHWILYSLPVCLQFIILCLLVLYFAQVCIKINFIFSQNLLCGCQVDVLTIDSVEPLSVLVTSSTMYAVGKFDVRYCYYFFLETKPNML